MLRPQIKTITGNLNCNVQITIEPFRRGLGRTVGWALRRTLLSSIVGVAVTQVMIEEMSHQFQPVYGVTEDISQIISNIRKIIFWTSESVTTAVLIKNTPGPFQAKDIVVSKRCKIINPDQIIGHLEDGRISMRFKIERGWGFIPKNKTAPSNSNTIILDASFTPVKRVSYTTREIRTETNLDAEKLILEIETNGATSPLEVLRQSVKIMRTQLSFEGSENYEA
ncbi:DNA-directed RNA polymerase subunit alpha [Candidatus Tremblaya phenacola PAVE]|nr:DNA-directed RNA polymerase subunit alpha [Candidatus Tremblaya phenacola PAVE]